MPRIVRKQMKQFGSGAGPTELGVFGSYAAGSPAYSSDPDTIQSLSNYLEGWYAAILAGNAPAIQDMNSLFFLYAYQLAYIFESGIPEWNTATTYWIGSLVTNSTGNIYKSLADSNTGNAVTDATKWVSLSQPLPVTINPATQSPFAVTALSNGITYLVNSANGTCTFTLPAAIPGVEFTVKDVGGVMGTSNATIDPDGTDTIEGLNADFACSTDYGTWTFQGTSGGWVLI